MNQTKQILFSVLMAFVMMATCPQRMWAQEPTQVSTASELTSALLSSSSVSAIKLTGDISTSSILSVSKNVTIDLNGHTITSTNSSCAVGVYSNGTLTMINGSLNSSSNDRALSISGTVILRNCDITAKGKCVTLESGEGGNVLTIEGNTSFTSFSGETIRMTKGTLNINGVCAILGDNRSARINNLGNPINIADGLTMIDSRGSQITNFNYYIAMSEVAAFVVKESCTAGQHTLQHHEGVAATCTEGGNAEYWNCTTCGRYYANAQCTSSLSSFVTSALGHNMVDDACTRCDYAIPSITVGTHTGIDIAKVSDGRHLATGYNLYKFIAPGNGTLTVAAEGSGDSFGALFDASYTKLIDDDDSNGHSDFIFNYTITKGQTYYIGLRPLAGNVELKNFTITVTFEEARPYAGCEYEYVARPNQNEDGSITWNDYYPVCKLHQEEASTCAIVSKDNGATYTFNVGGPSEEPAEVIMPCDLTLPEGKKIELSRGENILLDLNGKTISSHVSNEAIYLTDGSLTITDNSKTQSGTIINEAGDVLSADDGNLTIHGGKFWTKDNNSRALYIDGRYGIHAEIDGGHFISTESDAIYKDIPVVAMNYSYYSGDEEVEESDGLLRDENNQPYTDLIVKPAVKYAITVTANFYDDEDMWLGTMHFTSFDKAFETISDNDSHKIVITLNTDQTFANEASDSKDHIVIIDLNGHTLDGTYEGYEDEWSDEAQDYVKIPGSEYNKYHGLNFSSNTTIKNGTMKASVGGIGNTNVLTLDNATLVGDYISWQSETGIDVTNSSTLHINSEIGYGSFTVEDCRIDATSKVVLTGVNSIGLYGHVPGGYRNILHRLQLPEGYVLKQPFEDFNFGIYTEDNPEDKANMKGITFTINGADPLDECTDFEYIEVPTHNEEWTSYWTNYCRVCKLCHRIFEEGSVLSDDGDNYKYYYGGEEPAILTIDEEGEFTTDDVIVINDSKPFFAPKDIKASSVRYDRNIVKDGGKYSFFVPFEIPASLTASLGKFYEYSHVSESEGKAYFNDITLVGSDDEKGIVKANTGYFFDPAESISSITVANTTIKATTDIDSTSPSEAGIYGTYSQIGVPTGAYGYVNNGTFVKAGTGNQIRPFRAYLWLGSGITLAKVQAVFGSYEEETGINAAVGGIDLNAPIYNLNGQRIMNPLKGEIYIQNGKKVIKK